MNFKTNKLMTSLTLCSAVLPGIAGNNLTDTEKPNVVVFVVDDLRPELGCYSHSDMLTPNIDAIASDGVRFNNAYAQQALSGPSRMCFLTGNRPETIGIYSIFTPLRSVHKNMLTMPQYFKQNGYTTVSVGKVYHHATDDKSSWSIHIPKENAQWVNHSGKNGDKPPYECADVADEAYPDGRVARDAVKILNDIKDKNFIMFVGFSKPHLPFNAPKKYWDMYDESKLTVPFKGNPEGMYPQALTKWVELRGYTGMPQEGFVDDETSRRLIHGYHACVSYTDAQIGKVMNALDELKLRDNTIVVIFGDHGWKLGEYGAWCKHSNFQIDLNVPLIISREKDAASRNSGVTTDAKVGLVDLFPTLAEACGLAQPDVDGESIMEVLENPNTEWKDYACSVYPRGKRIMGFTCTDGKYRYTEWWDNEKNQLSAAEFYTCEQDFSRREKNLVKDTKYSKDIARLKGYLEEQFPLDKRSSYPQNDRK